MMRRYYIRGLLLFMSFICLHGCAATRGGYDSGGELPAVPPEQIAAAINLPMKASGGVPESPDQALDFYTTLTCRIDIAGHERIRSADRFAKTGIFQATFRAAEKNFRNRAPVGNILHLSDEKDVGKDYPALIVPALNALDTERYTNSYRRLIEGFWFQQMAVESAGRLIPFLDAQIDLASAEPVRQMLKQNRSALRKVLTNASREQEQASFLVYRYRLIAHENGIQLPSVAGITTPPTRILSENGTLGAVVEARRTDWW